jgi:hypothetical protein
MARQINVVLDGVESIFDFKKIDRTKLYGRRKRIVLDADGKACVKAELSEDGTTIITQGMAMQAYFDDDGEWVEHGRMIGLSEEGEPVKKVPSTLGKPQDLEESTPEALSQNQMVAVYHLMATEVDPALKKRLDAGSIFKFPFNYRADYCAETGFLLANGEGVFALITRDVSPPWCQLKTVAVESFSEDVELDDELDFEMF